MANYELHYFAVRGRAEISRLIFAVAGVSFKNVRIEYKDWIGGKKSEYWMERMPALIINEVQYNQSTCIARYLANEFNLAGNTSLDRLRTDQVVELIRELLDEAIEVTYDIPADKKDAALEKFHGPRCEKAFTALEGLVSENGYFVGGTLTWADLMWFNFLDVMDPPYDYSRLNKYPKLDELRKKVAAHPRVYKWLQTREPDVKIL